MDDGTNDIVVQTQDKSSLKFFNLLMNEDKGDYFHDTSTKDGKPGDIRENMGVQYFKTTKWQLKPKIKGPVPSSLNYNLPPAQVQGSNEFYSVDGEKYPAQDVSGEVIKRILPIYWWNLSENVCEKKCYFVD